MHWFPVNCSNKIKTSVMEKVTIGNKNNVFLLTTALSSNFLGFSILATSKLWMKCYMALVIVMRRHKLAFKRTLSSKIF